MVRRGSSLVEVLVAVVLCGFGLSALGTTTAATLRLAMRAESATRTTLAARSLLDSLAAVPQPVPGVIVVPGDTLRWMVEGEPPVLVLASQRGARFRLRTLPVLPELEP